MPRYDLQLPQPNQSNPNDDLVFAGLAMKPPREQLEPGYLARSENKRLIHGAKTRPGTRTPVFANLYHANGFAGSGVFSNPNGQEIGLLAGVANTVIIGIQAGTQPINITNLQPFFRTVEFVQHFDKVYAHNVDPSKTTLVWDGLDPNVGFIPIMIDPDASMEPGFAIMPNPPYSVNYLGRAWFPIPGSPDSIGASDVNDPTTYDSDLHTFRVNTGTSDSITGIYPFLSNNLIIGKERSIDLLENIPPDLGDGYLNSLFLGLSPASAQPPQVVSISTQVGITARKSGIMVAGNFMFLSSSGQGGIYEVQSDQHGQLKVMETPVSDPIQPLIDRINWTYASGAVAALSGIYAYWAVPIDGATFNNAMLVFNVVTSQWESLDLWNALPRLNNRGTRTITTDNPMRMDNIIQLNYYGNSDLFAVNNDAGKVHRLYHGTDDQLETAMGPNSVEQQTYPIQDLIETRGYYFRITYFHGSNINFNADSAAIGLATFEPSITIDALVDGSDGTENTQTPVPITKSRTKYDLEKAPYFLDNRNMDANAQKRQDYAVHMDDQVVLGPNGVRMQHVRDWTFPPVLSIEGRFISFRIANNGGICEVRNVTMESSQQRTERVG